MGFFRPHRNGRSSFLHHLIRLQGILQYLHISNLSNHELIISTDYFRIGETVVTDLHIVLTHEPEIVVVVVNYFPVNNY